MTAITWDNLGDRVYETGVDRGVLFFRDGGGVAWNGLTSVEHKSSTEVEPTYFDGRKVNDIVVLGDFSAVLKALTYPDEFLQFEGFLEDQDGFVITGQPLETFGLCYRTMVGNDLDQQAGYKIHLLWNLTAIPSDTEYQTMSLDLEPVEFEWEITAVPESIDNYRPTAHVILDSRKLDPYLISDIEELLYGTEETDPKLPSLKGLSAFIRKWNRLVITDNGDGTWTATSENPEYPITMLDSTTFEITSDTAFYLDAETYEISSSEKNEEDI